MPLPLDNAVRGDRLEEVRQLLEHGADPNARWGTSGDHFTLQEILDTGGGYAVSTRVEMMRLLLSHGADPNARWCPFESRVYFPDHGCTSKTATTPLHAAAVLGEAQIVEMLLAHGADPEVQDWADATALEYAADEISFELISRALFPDSTTRDLRALALVSAYRGALYGQAELGATALSRTVSRTLVYTLSQSQGVEHGQPGRVRALIRIGADPNEQVPTPYNATWPPLALAILHGRRGSTRALLNNGADINARWCVPIGRSTNSRPDPACTRANGTTALMLAAATDRKEDVEVLMAFAADVSLKDWAGRTAADLTANQAIKKLLTKSPPPYR